MIGLCIVPLCRAFDLGGDRFALVPLFSHLFFDFLGDLHLFIVLSVDGRAILCSSVCTLTIEGCRVVHLEEVLAQLTVGDSFRIKNDQKGLGVSGSSGADIVITGCFGLTSSISNSAVEKTFVAPIFTI